MDRRASRRIAVNEVARFERAGRRAVGLVTSINASGVFISTPHVVDEGAEIELCFELPDRGPGLRAAGRVVRANGPAHFDGRSPMGLGVRFLSMDRATRARIDDFLGRSGEG